MDQQPDQPEDLWVFAYGSLLWKPGFEFVEQRRASLNGYRRSFCMWSIHHRGTIDDPGLVLALDPDESSSCEGMVFRVEHSLREDVLAYLRERELVSSAYLERFEQVKLSDGTQVEAVAYVMDRSHSQYTGTMSVEERAKIIARSSGGMGPNDTYLFSTLEQLLKMGVADAEMSEIARLVQEINGQS